jgi:hypothetical protein
LEKREDGAGRHFVHTAIINSAEFMTSIRPENGAFYDGTAALNTYELPVKGSVNGIVI